MFQALLPGLMPIVGDVLKRFLPEDKEARAEAERALEASLATHLAQIDLAQLEINRTEAAHRSVFVAGWRPFIGWTCGVAIGWTYVAQPFLTFALAHFGMLAELPVLDLSQMMPLLMGMLGLGGLRTFEKFKRISK